MLTGAQIVAIMMLLQAFGVSDDILENVGSILANSPQVVKTQEISHFEGYTINTRAPEAPVITRLIYRKASGIWEIDGNKPLDLSEVVFIKSDGSTATTSPLDGWDNPQDVNGRKHYKVRVPTPTDLVTYQVRFKSQDGAIFTSEPYSSTSLESELIIY